MIGWATRRVAVSILCSALSSASACRSPQTDTPGSAAEPAEEIGDEVDLLALVASLGEGSSTVFVAHPHRWSTASSLNAFVRRLDPRQTATGPELLVLSLLRIAQIPTASTELNGWDRSRPIVMGIADPVTVGPPGAATIAMALDAKAVRLRYEAVIPADDPAALVEALDRTVSVAGTPAPRAVGHIAGASARALAHGGLVAAIPEPEAVRLVAIVGAVGRDLETDPQAFRADLAARAEPSAQTPGLRAIAASDATIAALVRPGRLAAAFAVFGMIEAYRVLPTLSPDQRVAGLARATQIVLDSELLAGQARAEFEEWALISHTDAIGSRIDIVGTGAPGASESARPDIVAAAPLIVGPGSAAQLTLRGAPGRGRGSTLDDPARREALQSCGFACLAPIVLSSPVAEGRALLPPPFDDFAALWDAPYSSLQVAVIRDPSAGPKGAVAIRLATRASASKLKRALAAGIARYDLQSEVVDLPTGAVLLLGWRMGGREAFELRDDDSAPAHATFSLELTGLMPGGDDGVPTLSGSFEASAAGWLGQVLFSTDPKAQPVIPAFDGFAGRAATDPHAKAIDCLLEAGWALSRALKSLSTEERAAAMARELGAAFADARPGLQCATNDSHTASTAKRLARYSVTAGARRLVEIFRIDAAVGLLDAECTRSTDPTVCDLARSTRELPRPQLAKVKVETKCDEFRAKGHLGVPIVVAQGAIAIAGRVVRAEARELDEALSRVVGAEQPAMNLAVDRAASGREIVPVLAALWERGVEGVWIATESGGRVVSIPTPIGKQPVAGRRSLRVSATTSWARLAKAAAKNCRSAVVF